MCNPVPVRNSPVGIFDSGVGGLSVTRKIRHLLRAEHLVYFADSGFAPYGAKSTDYITERSIAITEFLLQQGVKAVVVHQQPDRSVLEALGESLQLATLEPVQSAVAPTIEPCQLGEVDQQRADS